MTQKIFISYSHADSDTLIELRKFLKTLEREGLIDGWSDQKILAGGRLDEEIQFQLAEANLFLPLLSQDFIASEYCYETEMETAISREAKGELQIIPVIAQPCTWKNTPLAKYKILPKDAKPISEWTNKNNAFVDIEQEIRKLVENGSRINFSNTDDRPTPKKLNVKQARDFTAIDKLEFQDEAFRKICSYMKASVEELQHIDTIQIRFEMDGDKAFAVRIVNRLKYNSDSSMTLRNRRGSDQTWGQSITISNGYLTSENQMNDQITVDHDDYRQFLNLGYSLQNAPQGFTAEEVAQKLWDRLLEGAEISYD